MAKNYSKVKRGMVFWFNPIKVYGEPSEYVGSNGRTYKSHVQNNNRPWLVISNDDGNNTAQTCNIVPITLEEKTNIPTHVRFVSDGKFQTILCEQPRTVDIPALGEYMYTLSDNIMERVDKALAIQNGIKPSVLYADFKLDNVLKNLEEMISRIIQEKAKILEESKKVIPISDIEDTALRLGTMLEELVSDSPITQPKQPSEEPEVEVEDEDVIEPSVPATENTDRPRMSQMDKFNTKYNRTSSETAKKPEVITKPKRNSWTLESRRVYLEDCDKLSPQEIMKKYGFSTIQTVFQTKYQCKNFLQKIDKQLR